jgi:sugar phosphate isomerase/epimerase
MADLLHAGRVERPPPGEGDIDIRSILRHMPRDIPVALEVPMTAMTAGEGTEVVALRVRRAAAHDLAAALR